MTVDQQRFVVVSDYQPAGDQPRAISQLAEGIERGDRFQTLLGITGSGKSATIAWTIEKVQRPTLILAPNKSLAAQLAQEMKEFFPKNRVEYFVSYYDYYQPEAYIASSDTFIEKDSSVNDEIDRLRHSATAALLTRRDTIVVASVSCIYGMGNPEEYRGNLLELHVGVVIRRVLVRVPRVPRVQQPLRSVPSLGPQPDQLFPVAPLPCRLYIEHELQLHLRAHLLHCLAPLAHHLLERERLFVEGDPSLDEQGVALNPRTSRFDPHEWGEEDLLLMRVLPY